ncbi:MAG TPA: BamA/TamA family outer membrane protein [Puia sp.]|nr:BamA/TamA family outer membrane protein [Puia sp.]
MRRTLRIISPLIAALLSGVSALAQGGDRGDRVIQRMYLVGDAGELADGHHPVCDWLKAHVDWNDTSNVLVYLGDNIYPHGMPDVGAKDYETAKRIIDYQISVVEGHPAKAYFIPGNHDWRKGKPGGWDQIKNQASYINGLQLPNVAMLPAGGCPGPVEVRVGEKMVLVCMDSQWWLEDEGDRPGLQSGCSCKDENSIVTALKDIISTYPDRLIVVAMHHAFYTHGEHGGYYTIKQHIFPLTDRDPHLYIPLPVIGSIYPIARGVFGNIQDTRNPRYKEMIEKVEEVMRGQPNVIHVAGHEHTLQLLQHDSIYYVVSGAGSKHTRVKMGKNSLWAREGVGFAVIELTESGRASVKFYEVTAPGGAGVDSNMVYTAQLAQLRTHEEVVQAVGKYPDSVTVPAYTGFKAGGFKRWLLGANYRTEWAAPVRVPVFDLTGWKPLQRGGGNQTRSLRMENADGTQYVLRGVQKYVKDEALPQALQGTFVKDLVADGVSASYPYAALSIPPMAKALQIPHANPRLVFIPDDPRLGRFRTDFANLFCLIEEREPGNGKKTYNMDDLEEKIKEDNDNTIDQHRVLRARSLDMFVMDFDRHEDQWRWQADDNGKGKTFSPVPRDRDQPFFINEGLIPWVAGSAFVTPQIQGFRPKARNFLTYNFNARNFDRNYMNELTEKDWRDAVRAALDVMTDSMIEASLKLQPLPIQGQGYSMQSIIDKLKERRKYYAEELVRYYKFLARSVSVYGSDKRELFDISRNEDGTVKVTMYKISKDGDTSKKLYERVFLSGETKEVRLYGLGGDDQFKVHGNGGGGIVVRIIGGPGNDAFDNASGAGAGKTRIYDQRTEKNVFNGDGHYRNFLSEAPSVNAINKLGFKYNVLTPFINVGYNPDDGVFLGVQFWYTTQGFHKDPYKQLHYFSALHALSTKAYAFKYNFEAIDAIGRTDLLFHGAVLAPNNTINFFGLGNETGYDRDKTEGIRYYRARFAQYDADLQIRKRLGKVFQVAAGPAFELVHVDSSDNKDRFINHTELNGLDPATLYKWKSYAGGRATVIIDNRDDKINPGRGIFWESNFSAYGGLGQSSNNFSRLQSDLALFISFNTRKNVVIATRAGYGKTFGHYEFYQAQFLGATENLRGYRKFRFAGDEELYHNIDLRIKLAEFRTYLFPGSFGLQFFNDVGRVWLRGEKSDSWHDGFGGGLWISPLKRFVLTASYAKGTEGGVTLIKLGWQY